MRLPNRLTRVEDRLRPPAGPTVLRVFLPEELVPCTQHPACDVELETGNHHRGVIHLDFGGDFGRQEYGLVG